jgi:uncharacterized protein (DUF433 family)
VADVPKGQFASLRIQPGADPRDLPAYSIREAAHLLRLPVATLKSWVSGRRYTTKSGAKFFKPVIELPNREKPVLSFFNLVEAHVLSAFRRDHDIKLSRIRAALQYVQKQFDWRHPLIDQRFETDGATLFVEKLGSLVDASAGGQIVMETIRPYFQRLEFKNDTVVRFYPFTRGRVDDSPKWILIDPRISFGRPSLTRSRVPVAIIAERFDAGESIEDLAADYGCERLEIEEGLRCQRESRVAA